ncbi:MAG: DUF3179 domain-containing protein, partial [Saprospiraceae bacterium]
GQFINLATPEPQELIQLDSATGFHQLHFPEFLTIRHLKLKAGFNEDVQVAVSALEQQRFGRSSSLDIEAEDKAAVSRLYKIEPYLLFDQRGNILNKAAVREYDYWANQRLATTLPIDYKDFTKKELPKTTSKPVDTLLIFNNLVKKDIQLRARSLTFLENNWSDSFVAPLLDILYLSKEKWHEENIQSLLKKYAPQTKGEYFTGLQWLWENEPNYGDYYANFKADLYTLLDAPFYLYFAERGASAKIRLDEIVWGGVGQDGIPPLRSPEMVTAQEVSYLAPSDVVFGLVVNGKAYAYPKRILAWHEFFTDEIEGQSIAGVYCTLCGTVIMYNAEFEGVKHDLGTSGFLYRSNKLMYDRATQSLWSTIQGRPVMGPLAKQNIELSTLPVETTTWGAWRKRHPDTQVLSLETGYQRNYTEGEAYRDYFATDELMFPVPQQDQRLANKARVFIPRPAGYQNDPLAIAVDYLQQKGLHQDQIGDQRMVILTESNGSSRAYAIDSQQFKSYKRGKLVDDNKQIWAVTEEALINKNGERLQRISGHEVFWFAWVNVFWGTRVVR